MRLKGIIFFLGCIGFTLVGTIANGQPNKDLEKLLPTEKVGFEIKVDKKENRPVRGKMKYIIKNSTKGIYYGNPCALTVTRKMGFEYAVQTKGTAGSLSEFSRFFHNFGVKAGLSLRRTPFWKRKLKKNLLDCGIKSGDRVG